jgi:hypothetical protein
MKIVPRNSLLILFLVKFGAVLLYLNAILAHSFTYFGSLVIFFHQNHMRNYFVYRFCSLLGYFLIIGGIFGSLFHVFSQLFLFLVFAGFPFLSKHEVGLLFYCFLIAFLHLLSQKNILKISYLQIFTVYRKY